MMRSRAAAAVLLLGSACGAGLVQATPVITAKVTPEVVAAETGLVAWSYSTTDAQYCTYGGSAASSASERLPTSGSGTIGPFAPGSYSESFSCTGPTGTAWHTVSWEVVGPPIITAGVAPASVAADTGLVSWSYHASDAQYCTYQGSELPTSASGEAGPFAPGSYSANFSCTGIGGTTWETLAWEAVTDLEANIDPGAVPGLGFNDSHAATSVLIEGGQSGEERVGILVRAPASASLLRDFALVPGETGAFRIEEEGRSDEEIGELLAEIPASVLRLHDLNGDGLADLLLHGLDSHIDGAEDLFVPAPGQVGALPPGVATLDDDRKRFFRELRSWLEAPDYFDDNAPLASVPALIAGETVAFADPSGRLITSLAPVALTPAQREAWGCNALRSACVDVEADWTDLVSVTSDLDVSYHWQPHKVTIRDLYDDPAATNLWAVFRVRFSATSQIATRDDSGFHEHALLLSDYLTHPQYGTAARIARGSLDALRISQGLEWGLGVRAGNEGILVGRVFDDGLRDRDRGVFPPITVPDAGSVAEVARDILVVLAHVRNRVCIDAADCDAGPVLGVPPPAPPAPSPMACEAGGGANAQDCPLPWRPLPVACTADGQPPSLALARVGSGPLWQSKAPAMPAASFQVELGSMIDACEIVSLEWRATLASLIKSQKVPEGRSFSHSFVHRVPLEGGTRGPFSNAWALPWGELISGGRLNISVTLGIDVGGAVETLVAELETEVTGIPNGNLTEQIVTTFNGEIEKVAVAWRESTHRQFGGDGYPLYGPGDGFGVMQLDTIPGFEKREEHFWNWRVNVRKGGEYLDELYIDAQNYLIFHHRRDGLDPGKPAWEWDPNDAATNAAVDARIWDDAFSRYNAGVPIYLPDGNRGVENCSGNRWSSPIGCNYRNLVRRHIANRPWE